MRHSKQTDKASSHCSDQGYPHRILTIHSLDCPSNPLQWVGCDTKAGRGTHGMSTTFHCYQLSCCSYTQSACTSPHPTLNYACVPSLKRPEWLGSSHMLRLVHTSQGSRESLTFQQLRRFGSFQLPSSVISSALLGELIC